jgi:hypothetical protein
MMMLITSALVSIILVTVIIFVVRNSPTTQRP